MNSEQLHQDQSAIYNKYGAFFAFGNEQFNENKKDGVDYVSLGSGLIAPKGTAKQIIDEMDQAWEAHKNRTLDENSRTTLIDYELGNHECGYTGDYSDAVNVLEPYGITEEEVIARWPEYMRQYHEHN